jgi:uncharacterized protein
MNADRIERSRFVSGGVQCAATLHRPAGDAPAPAVLMVHGWGGVQDALTVPFYEPFQQLGFAVMTFDYPGWGASDGELRNDIDPRQRERNVEDALAHLAAQPAIDRARLVLWGTSFGGGHVVNVASRHSELLGAIAQVPMLDGMVAVKAVPPRRLLEFGVAALRDRWPTTGAHYVPVIGPPGALASMDRDGAAEAMRKGTADGIVYDNRVTARSLLRMGPYRPFKHLKNVQVPLLIIGATNDTVAPFVEDRIQQLAGPNVTVEILDANHFEPYFEPTLTQNLAYQTAFLRRLLTSSRGDE